MASNVTVTNNFTAGTPAVADAVDQNFTDVTTWINANAVHLDGSKAFTGIPSGPATDPTTANQFTRKSYVDAGDARHGGAWGRQATAQTFSAGTTTAVVWDTEFSDTDGFWSSGSSIVIPAGQGGVYVVSCTLSAVSISTMNANFGAVLTAGSTAAFAANNQYPDQASATIVAALSAGNAISVSVRNGGGVSFTAGANISVFKVSV